MHDEGVVLLRPEGMSINVSDGISTIGRHDAMSVAAPQHGTVSNIVYLGTDRQSTVAFGKGLHIDVRQQNQGAGIHSIGVGDAVNISLAADL